MTTRIRVVLGAGALALVLLSGCSSSGDSNADRETTTTTTTAAAGPSDWVKEWDSVLVTDYGPAQEEFLAAVKTAKVVDVQRAILKVRAANEKLGMAIRAAGDPPAPDRAAATTLLEGLGVEYTLIPQIQSTCIGTDPKCQQVVTLYADNNRDKIVAPLTELRAAS